MQSDFIAPIPLPGDHLDMMNMLGETVGSDDVQQYASLVAFAVVSLVQKACYTFFAPQPANPFFPPIVDMSFADELVSSGFIESITNCGIKESLGGDGGGGDGGGGDDGGDPDDELTDDDNEDEEEEAAQGLIKHTIISKKNQRKKLDQWRASFLAMDVYIKLLEHTKEYQKALHVESGAKFRKMSEAIEAAKRGEDIEVM